MKQNANLGPKALQAAQTDLYQQVIAGKPMGNPMALTGPGGGVIKTLEDLKPASSSVKTASDAVKDRFWRALYRDALYCTAGGVFLRSFGMRQAAREITDAANDQQRGGYAE